MEVNNMVDWKLVIFIVRMILKRIYNVDYYKNIDYWLYGKVEEGVE